MAFLFISLLLIRILTNRIGFGSGYDPTFNDEKVFSFEFHIKNFQKVQLNLFASLCS